MSELADYERRFRRAGLPLFIEDYSAREDVWTRASPLLALVFIGEMLGAIDLDWSFLANLAAALGDSPSCSGRSACSTSSAGGASGRCRKTLDRRNSRRSCSSPPPFR